MELNSGTKQILSFILNDWKLIVIMTTIFAIYFYYTSTFDTFKKIGVPYIKPVIFLGNLGSRLLGKISFHDLQLNIYNNFKGSRYGGTFDGRRPILNILDPDLIKAITIRDFDYFTDRNTLSTNERQYLHRSLLNLKGAEWKGVRSALTPVFSSSRLRNMLPIIELCSRQMVEFLRKFDNSEVEMKHTMGHFTLEVIGACAFGIECDALKDENAYFVKVAEKFDYMAKSKRMILFFFLLFMPKMIKYSRLSFLNTDSTDELVRILKVAKSERKTSATKQNDFLQLLIDFASKEKLEAETTGAKRYLDDDTIDAQSLLFLIAGYETSSTLLSFATHVLATKPDIQTKLRDHIQEMTKGKQVTTELLAEMAYLEGFILETLRMYPPVSRVDRTCTKSYTIPGSSIHLQPNDVVAIPIYGIHMDPDHYPEPHEFRPERFMGEEKNQRPSHLFLPFGVGPRNCIGLRFALFSAKIALISLLKNFTFSVGPRTENPLKFDRRAVLLKANIWVKIDKLQECSI